LRSSYLNAEDQGNEYGGFHNYPPKQRCLHFVHRSNPIKACLFDKKRQVSRQLAVCNQLSAVGF
jgi:hypothetical protein